MIVSVNIFSGTGRRPPSRMFSSTAFHMQHLFTFYWILKIGGIRLCGINQAEFSSYAAFKLLKPYRQ